MKLDLREDFKDIYSHLLRQVQTYVPGKNVLLDPGSPGSPITQINLGYEITQAGWVAFVLDARADATCDGEWTQYIDETMLERPKWIEATKLLDAGTAVEFTLPNGTIQTIAPNYDDEQYGAIYGNMLKDVLLKAKEDGAFAVLPLNERCQLAVEDFDGRFGWVLYEDGEQSELA